MDAIADIKDGATIMVGGFEARGVPAGLVLALKEKGVKDITLIRNDCSGGWKLPIDVHLLIEAGQIKKVVACWAVFGSPKKVSALETKVLENKIELELVPQGTLAERIRAGGAGIGAFYVPVGVGTYAGEGKEVRVINGKEMVLEHALTSDFALIKAHITDKLGNCVYRMAARNFNPIMATAAKTTIVETENLVEIGKIDPDRVQTPSIYVHRIVEAKKS